MRLAHARALPSLARRAAHLDLLVHDRFMHDHATRCMLIHGPRGASPNGSVNDLRPKYHVLPPQRHTVSLIGSTGFHTGRGSATRYGLHRVPLLWCGRMHTRPPARISTLAARFLLTAVRDCAIIATPRVGAAAIARSHAATRRRSPPHGSGHLRQVRPCPCCIHTRDGGATRWIERDKPLPKVTR